MENNKIVMDRTKCTHIMVKGINKGMLCLKTIEKPKAHTCFLHRHDEMAPKETRKIMEEQHGKYVPNSKFPGCYLFVPPKEEGLRELLLIDLQIKELSRA